MILQPLATMQRSLHGRIRIGGKTSFTTDCRSLARDYVAGIAIAQSSALDLRKNEKTFIQTTWEETENDGTFADGGYYVYVSQGEIFQGCDHVQ